MIWLTWKTQNKFESLFVGFDYHYYAAMLACVYANIEKVVK